MNLAISDEQRMLRDTFARFLDSESTMSRVRAADAAGGFDRALWQGLAELGTFSMRVPEEAGGLGLGTFDAALVMEEAGRMLASGPISETQVAARLLGLLHGPVSLLEEVIAGSKVATIAFQDIAKRPVQSVAGGAHVDVVIARNGDLVVALSLAENNRRAEENLASNGIGRVELGSAPQTVLGSGQVALDHFSAGLEEWKLLCAATLSGMTREALRLAAAYAGERRAFSVPIGTFQGLSHPLANLITDVEGGKYFLWKVIHEISTGAERAGAHIPLTLWWNAKTASAAGIQTLRTFGGYGLTTEYDIHLYNLRAKAWPLIHGDPQRLLEEAGRRLYGGEPRALPDVGPVSIDFDLGEEARELAREVDDFFRKTLTPELQAHAHHSWDGHHPLVHKKLAEANLLFPAWPKSKGGRGASPSAQHAAAQVWENHRWSNHAAGTTQMIAAMLDRFGSDEAKRDVLEPILAGDIVCSLGYSEPGSGSDVFAAQTRATRTDTGWRIDGTKMFTSGANLASYVLMLCRTNTDVPKHKGLTMFIVPLSARGVTVQPVYTFQDERTNITFYDGVRIPDSYRLGDVDGGVRVMSASLEIEQGSGFAKSQLALVESAEALCREIDHNDRPLIEDPLAQMRLARAWTHCLVAEMLGLRALWAAQSKLDVAAAGPMAKLFSSETFLADSSDLLDLTAPLSLFEHGTAARLVNLSYRYAHATTIWAGTSEIHRSMIAERALGLPRSRN
jgi:alkylation response protein AidB-like acyl-CoA dehydrogenase